MRFLINFAEVCIRIEINSFYNRMADYHLRQSNKYINDDKYIKRWRRHTKKSLDYQSRFWKQQGRIDELKDYCEERLKGFI